MSTFFAVVGFLIVGLAIDYEVYFRFANPSLSETQLFLKTWWLLIPFCVGAVMFAIAKEME